MSIITATVIFVINFIHFTPSN